MVEESEVCCYQGLVRRHQVDAADAMRIDAVSTVVSEAVDAFLAIGRPSNHGQEETANAATRTVVAMTLEQAGSRLPGIGEIVTCHVGVQSDGGPSHALRVRLTGPHGPAWIATTELSAADADTLPAPEAGRPEQPWPPMRLMRLMRKTHCDQAGHVNVQVFMDLADEAVGVLCLQTRRDQARLHVVKARISFKQELFEGDLVSVHSGVQRVDASGVDVVHGIVHQPSGRLACIVETRIAGLDDLGRPMPFADALPAFPGESIDDWACLPCARAPALPRVSAYPRPDAVSSAMSVVDAWDADGAGWLDVRAMVDLCSTGARQYLATIGLTGSRFIREKITVAAVDYLIEIHQRPRLGCNLTVRSDYLSGSAKSIRFSHHFMDSDDGVVYATVEIVGVMLDLVAHRSMDVPRDVAERLAAR